MMGSNDKPQDEYFNRIRHKQPLKCKFLAHWTGPQPVTDVHKFCVAPERIFVSSVLQRSSTV
jgi:hypothetical protein